MSQEYNYHIWTEESPVSVKEIITANAKAHGVEPSEHSMDIFEKKMISAYFGPALLAYATPHNKPLTVCGAVAYGVYEISINGKTEKGGIAYASFVVPEFQGKGIFKKLISFAQQKCKENGYSVLMCFPNAKSLAGYKSAGWHSPVGTLRHMLKPASPKATLRCTMYFKDLKRNFSATPSSEETIAENCESIKSIFKNGKGEPNFDFENLAQPVRSEGFYTWRLCALGQASYGIELNNSDFIIYRRGTRGRLKEIQLLDYSINLDNRSLKRIIKTIVKKENADLLSGRISAKHPIYKSLKSMMFLDLGKNKNLNFSYLILDDNIDGSKLSWALTALDLHMS